MATNRYVELEAAIGFANIVGSSELSDSDKHDYLIRHSMDTDNLHKIIVDTLKNNITDLDSKEKAILDRCIHAVDVTFETLFKSENR